MIESAERRPRDIQERAFDFACRIVRLHSTWPSRAAPHGRLPAVLRSGTSIAANLEEVSAGQSKADFVSKCSIALKEARETTTGFGCSWPTTCSHRQTTALPEEANTWPPY